MGTTGYKELMDERKENYKILKHEMTKIAEKYGERVLETKNNPVSIGEFKLPMGPFIYYVSTFLGFLPKPLLSSLLQVLTLAYIIYKWSHFHKLLALKNMTRGEKRSNI